VVQAVAVATLATILVSFVTPEVKALQERAQGTQAATSTTPFGICSTPGVPPEDNLPPGTSTALANLPAQAAQAAEAKILATLQVACDQYMQGFEAAYRVTLYASLGALLLAVFLPGWPGKWGGRGAMQGTPPAGH